MIPFSHDPLAHAEFSLTAIQPATDAERDLLDALRILLDYATGADADFWRAQRAREAAEAEVRELKRLLAETAEIA